VLPIFPRVNLFPPHRKHVWSIHPAGFSLLPVRPCKPRVRVHLLLRHEGLPRDMISAARIDGSQAGWRAFYRNRPLPACARPVSRVRSGSSPLQLRRQTGIQTSSAIPGLPSSSQYRIPGRPSINLLLSSTPLVQKPRWQGKGPRHHQPGSSRLAINPSRSLAGAWCVCSSSRRAGARLGACSPGSKKGEIGDRRRDHMTAAR